MRLTSAAASLVALATIACAPGRPASGILVRDVRVVSPERADPTPPVSVYLRDGRIVEISNDPSPATRAADSVIHGDGRYLVPGLIDGHVHLAEVPGMLPQHETAFPEIAAEARRQIPRSYLYHGFTTVVDLNSTTEAMGRWNAAPLRPQAYFCGGAPTLDGYPSNFVPPEVRYQAMPYFLADPARAAGFPAGIDPTEHTPEAVVARMRAGGAICVKTFFEHGFGAERNLPVPALETIRALAVAARHHGMPLLLHANSAEAQAFGLTTGVDAMAHGIWKWQGDPAAVLPAEVTGLLDSIAARKLGWQPTIQVLYGERDLFDPGYLGDSALADVLPRSLIDWYRTPTGRWWYDDFAAVPYVRALLAAGRWAEVDADAIGRVQRTLGYLASHRGRLLFGSDTPSGPTWANPPGLNARREMDRWIAAGVSPAELFRAATIANAEFYRLAAEIGTVEVGKRGNLLLLRKNPLQDVTAWDAIDLVILGGRVIPRAELSARSPFRR